MAMCKFNYTVEITEQEIYNSMLVPGEYKKIGDKFFIPDIPGFRDGYICPCYLGRTGAVMWDGTNLVITGKDG